MVHQDEVIILVAMGRVELLIQATLQVGDRISPAVDAPSHIHNGWKRTAIWMKTVKGDILNILIWRKSFMEWVLFPVGVGTEEVGKKKDTTCTM